jgi:hypothetical protein
MPFGKATKPEAGEQLLGVSLMLPFVFLSYVHTVNDSNGCTSVTCFFCYKLPHSPTTMKKNVSQPFLQMVSSLGKAALILAQPVAWKSLYVTCDSLHFQLSHHFLYTFPIDAI